MKEMVFFILGTVAGIVIDRLVIKFNFNRKTKNNIKTIIANNGSVSGQNINGKISIDNNKKNL